MSLLRRNITREPTIDTLVHMKIRVQEQAAKHHIRVMLSGWGGDELITFNGVGLLYATVSDRGDGGKSSTREVCAPGGRVIPGKRLVTARLITPESGCGAKMLWIASGPSLVFNSDH